MSSASPLRTTVGMEECLFLWQQGIQLWEEQGAYLDAMDTWEAAVQALPMVANALLATDDDPLLPPKLVPPMTTPNIAPLLLFLAGCFLDAGNHQKARTFCQCAWKFAVDDKNQNDESTTSTNNNDPNNERLLCESLNHRILCEYMAAWEEDDAVMEPWKLSYRIAMEALEQRQEQQETTGTAIPRILWNNPYQRPAFCYPIPPEAPYHSLAVCPRNLHPPWAKLMEQDYHIFYDEFRQLCQNPNAYSNKNNDTLPFPHHWPTVGAGSHRQGSGSHDGSVVNSHGDWRELVLFGAGATTTAAPQTRQWIRRNVPDAVQLAQEGGGEVIFSVLAPHTQIGTHCASTNLRWTAHLGLATPTNAKIRVADEWHHWQPGKVLIFDDSFEHQVSNDTNEIRAVLLLRFWHPNVHATSERALAIQKALEWKQVEEHRRYHPPHPVSSL